MHVKKWIWTLIVALISWNLYLTINQSNLKKDRKEVTVAKNDEGVTIVQNTLNGYTTDITKTVSLASSHLVSIFDPANTSLTKTGVIYEANDDGVYILTSLSAIQNNETNRISFDNGMEYDANIVGFDEQTDVCVLHVFPEFSCSKIAVGDSDFVKHGEYAIGLGAKQKQTQAGSVSFGVISKTAQVYMDPSNEESTPWITSCFSGDVTLNDELIGGPLVNLSGQMIGLVSKKLSDRNISSGLLSAVASDELVLVADQIIDQGVVNRGYLGVVVGPIKEVPVYQKSALNIPIDTTSGLLIYDVVEDSPADAAGLHYGDVILKINKLEMQTMNDLRKLLYANQSEAVNEFKILREGNAMTLSVVFDD